MLNVAIIQVSVNIEVKVIAKKNAVVIIPMAIMFMYSAIKIRANVPELYSVLNPETSSDSPSAKSNGVRLVSAREVIIQAINIGHIITTSMTLLFFISVLNLKEAIMIIGDKITSAIDTSYEIVWAILRSAPSSAYLLLDAQPENRVVYTFILDTHRNNIIPYFSRNGALV